MNDMALVVGVLICLVLFQRSVLAYIAIHSFECTPSTTLCPTIVCRTTVTRYRMPLMTCGCKLARPMHNLTAEFVLKRRVGRQYEPFIRLKGNLCDIIKRTNRSQGLSKLFSGIKQYFNRYECPFQGNVTVINLPLGLNLAPAFMPSSSYQLHYELTDMDDFVLTVQMKFTIGKYVRPKH